MTPEYPSLEPGSLLVNRYRIVERIGGGGMGAVYQARDKRLADRLCAVKELIQPSDDPTHHEKAVDDFLRESQLLTSLEHRSIPTIFDYFVDAGRYYLVMKYISGGDLAAEVERRGGRVDERTVTHWAIQVCDVLEYLHGQSPPIIYRDLKPGNLMLDKEGRVMLIDFGIARFVAPTVKGVTAIGTMGYAPPELFAGKVEPRSDIYSLGATMFHMLTGSDPQTNPLIIFDFAVNPRLSQLNPAATPEIDAIVTKMVAYRPEDRQASAAELKRILEEHERRLSGEARQPPCTNCSEPIPADALFCAHCGAHARVEPVVKAPQPGWNNPTVIFPQQSSAAAVAAAPAPAKRARLVHILEDCGDGERYDLDRPETRIGRAAGDITFPKDGFLSGRHAKIVQRDGRFFVADHASRNGTFVKIREEIELRPGDTFLVGKQVFKFDVESKEE